jgi:hypothetical protein
MKGSTMNTRPNTLQAFGFATGEAGNDNARFGVWPNNYDGSIVHAEKVVFARPPFMPAHLAKTFNMLRENQTPAQLVTVRKANVMEARDNSHLDHFLIPAETPVQIVGMTI